MFIGTQHDNTHVENGSCIFIHLSQVYVVVVFINGSWCIVPGSQYMHKYKHTSRSVFMFDALDFIGFEYCISCFCCSGLTWALPLLQINSNGEKSVPQIHFCPCSSAFYCCCFSSVLYHIVY